MRVLMSFIQLRLAIIVGILLGLSPVVPAQVRSAAPADAWPQFRGTPELSGVSTATIPDDLELLWTFDAGESIDSSAAVADGTVYVGTYLGELIALDLETGAEQWRYQASETFGIGESSPAVADGLVFVGDLAGGAARGRSGDGPSPLDVRNPGRDQVLTCRRRHTRASSDRTTASCTHSRARMVRWPGNTKPSITSTRRRRWPTGSPTLAGAMRSFGASGSPTARRWLTFQPVRTPRRRQPSPAPGTYFGTFNNEVLALDLGSQDMLWRYEHHTRHFPFYSSALNVDGKVIIGGRDRMVHAIDEATGVEVWTFMTRARVDSSPATAGGRVYIGSGDGRLYVLDVETGEKLWEFDTAAPLSASPAIAAGKVVISSQDGIVYCFG